MDRIQVRSRVIGQDRAEQDERQVTQWSGDETISATCEPEEQAGPAGHLWLSRTRQRLWYAGAEHDHGTNPDMSGHPRQTVQHCMLTVEGTTHPPPVDNQDSLHPMHLHRPMHQERMAGYPPASTPTAVAPARYGGGGRQGTSADTADIGHDGPPTRDMGVRSPTAGFMPRRPRHDTRHDVTRHDTRVHKRTGRHGQQDSCAGCRSGPPGSALR